MIKIPAQILLVDDEKDFVEMLAARLTESGENVAAASSGQEALDKLKAEEYDVVILDIKMPGMDGIQTLRQIKSLSPLVEVILLTGHGSAQTAVDGMKLGAFDYLLKPADFEDLAEKLEGAVKKKEAQQERIRKAEARLLLRRGGNI